jgi:hypothetical protein
MILSFYQEEEETFQERILFLEQELGDGGRGKRKLKSYDSSLFNNDKSSQY